MQFQGRSFSWKALGAALGSVFLSVLPAIRTGSLAGTSEILVAAYACIWAFVFARAVLHLCEGYLWKGLWWETLLELSTVVLWGLLVLTVVRQASPQIVRLAAFAAAASVLLFVSSALLERGRERLASGKNGVRLRRGTEVVKSSWLWRETCDLFGRLNTRPTERLREWLSSEDSDDGLLSRAGLFALCAVVSLAVAAGSLTIAGTILGMPLTAPKTSESGKGGKSSGQGGKKGGSAARDNSLYGSNGSSSSSGLEGASDPAESPDSSCGFDYDPGPRVSEPQRSSLMLAWHQVDGIVPGPLEALGSDIAGCPGRARLIPGKPNWWYVTGYCEDSVRSVAIAPVGVERPITMLEQAAEFALPRIQKREFDDAVERFQVGGGDAYIVDLTAGSFVLIRIHSNAGSLGPGGAGEGCNHFTTRDVAYTVVPPALIPGWRSVAAISSGGVYPISVTHPSGDFESFVFVSNEGVEAEGRCWHQSAACGVKIEGRWILGSPTRTDQREVEALTTP